MSNFANFAFSTVLTAPSPGSSGTSLVVQSGDGAKFPAPPFNVTIWPTAVQPSTTNAEIATVTAVSTDTLTITRAQESSTARSVIVGDQIALTVTAAALSGLQQLDGWLAVSEAWTYASATTITVPTGATARYQKGDRIKITQSATVKYFYIASVATTVLTVTGGSDYTVSNSAISNQAVSHQLSPVGFPQWFNYAETWTGYSVAPTGGYCQFCVIGTTVTVNINRPTAGTSNANTNKISLPITGEALGVRIQMSVQTMDNSVESVTSIGTNDSTPSSTTFNFYKDIAGTVWTATGSKRANGYFTYVI